MDALIAPLERVVEAADWFVRTPSLRLLHISTTTLMRNAVLSHVAAAEVLPYADGPLFVLETPATADEGTWDARVEELRLDWQEFCASAPAGQRVEALPVAVAGDDPLTRFASVLAHCLARLPQSARELIVVLAPMGIGDDARSNCEVGDHWRSHLGLLLGTGSLSRARFVVVETESDHTRALVDSLGAQAESVDAMPDLRAVEAEEAARLSNLRAAPAGSTGAVLIGGAGPSVLPPARVGTPAATAVAGGLDPDVMRGLHVAVLSAAAAMRAGDTVAALREQRGAVELCLQHGLTQQAVVNELVLGGYALAAGCPPLACEVFVAVRDRALAAELHAQGVLAWMAIASCLALQAKHHEAALAYSDAAHAAERAGATALAIEAYRACGQLMLSVGEEALAARAFRRALDVADAGDPRGSSAVEAARALSKICRASGLRAQADSLDVQVAQLEQRELPAAASTGA